MRNVRTKLCLLASVALAIGLAWGCGGEEGLTVKRLSRNQGKAGDSITIHGTGFQAGGTRAVRVYFGNRKAPVIGFNGDSEIKVEVPGGHDYGTTVDIELVFEPGGSITYPKAFKYADIPRLEVEDFEKDKKGEGGK